MTPERIRDVLDKVMVDLDDLSNTIDLLESLGDIGDESPIRFLGDQEIVFSELVDEVRPSMPYLWHCSQLRRGLWRTKIDSCCCWHATV